MKPENSFRQILPLIVMSCAGLFCVVGLLPALSRSSIVTALRESSDKSTAPEHKQNLRKILVASQIAITFVLLVCTGLMARSIFKLQERRRVPSGSDVQ